MVEFPYSSFLPKLHLSKPRDLLSAPFITPMLAASCPFSRGSSSPGSLCLCTGSSLLGAWGESSEWHQCPWPLIEFGGKVWEAKRSELTRGKL